MTQPQTTPTPDEMVETMTQPEDTVREALEYANGLMQTGTTVYIGFSKALSALSALVAERDRLREALEALVWWWDNNPDIKSKCIPISKARAALGGEGKEIGKQN